MYDALRHLGAAGVSNVFAECLVAVNRRVGDLKAVEELLDALVPLLELFLYILSSECGLELLVYEAFKLLVYEALS